MIPCPACGSKTIAQESVPYNGLQYRYRKCVSCSKHIYTVAGERRIERWPTAVHRIKNSVKRSRQGNLRDV